MAHKKAILPTISKACSNRPKVWGPDSRGKGNKSAKMLFFSVEGGMRTWVTRKHRSLNPLVALPNPSHT